MPFVVPAVLTVVCTQLHFNPAANAPLVQKGMHKLPYWGMVIFEADSYEKLLEVGADEEYQRVCLPEENAFRV